MIFKLFRRKRKAVQNCSTCKFNYSYGCNVGTHYAEKGLKGLCYEGELWEAKTE